MASVAVEAIVSPAGRAGRIRAQPLEPRRIHLVLDGAAVDAEAARRAV
jgi:hypothetical protein